MIKENLLVTLVPHCGDFVSCFFRLCHRQCRTLESFLCADVAYHLVPHYLLSGFLSVLFPFQMPSFSSLTSLTEKT